MHSDDPTAEVTAIIPTYRRPSLLRRAALSVLNQSFNRIQVLVLDNASGDETERVVRDLMSSDPRIEYHRHVQNIGLAANFQYGLKNVATPYFSFLSDDDLLFPEFYSEAIQKLEKHPEAMFAVSGTVGVTDKGQVQRMAILNWAPGLYRPPDGLMSMVHYGIPTWTSIVFRTEIRERIGFLDPEAGAGIDRDFELRAAAKCAYVVSLVPGAIFTLATLKPHGGRHPYPFDGIWPGWQKTMQKISTDHNIPAEIRMRVDTVLREKFKRNLLILGLRYLYTRQVQSASMVADVLSIYFDMRWRARLLRLFVFAHRVIGPLVFGYFLGVGYGIKSFRSRMAAEKIGAPYSEKVNALLQRYRTDSN